MTAMFLIMADCKTQVDLTLDINSNREGIPMALWQAYLQETVKKSE